MSQIGEDQKQYEWIFEISVTVSLGFVTLHSNLAYRTVLQTTQTLTSVVLFDSLSNEFKINSITHLSTYERHQSVNVFEKMKAKVDQKIEPMERVQVKVSNITFS